VCTIIGLLAYLTYWSFLDMDRTIPPGAARLLDFIGNTEAPKGYGTVYGNKQARLKKPLVEMTLDEAIAAGPTWTRQFGSSAAGRYQFMKATLADLKKELKLTGRELLDADMQDRLGFHLLKRRGYLLFAGRKLSATGFGKCLAQEWASFPVLADTTGAKRAVKRGQSFYAGDGLNKSLVKPEAVEAVLAAVLAADNTPRVVVDPPRLPPDVPAPTPAAPSPQPAAGGFFVAALRRLFRKA
jgi:muramidase (phage lysozyme)